MAGTIKKRAALHKQLETQEQENKNLISHIGKMQAMANIGKTCSMIAHEINNVLTPLGNYAQLALNNPEDRKLAEKALQKTVKNSARAGHILDSMLGLVKGEAQDKKSCQLRTLVEDIFNCIIRDFSKDRITVDIRVPENLVMWAVPVQMQQVLMNLILNAREAMLKSGGILIISAKEMDGSVIIDITDTGSGMAEKDLSMIFEPFFTTKVLDSQAGRTGTGLGLAFCREIIQRHDGIISVSSEPDKGTAFKIILPQKNTTEIGG